MKTNNEFIFGVGAGHLSRRAEAIARRHGAVLVNHTDMGCRCGLGCVSDCPACRSHWFAAENMGEPINSTRSNAVLSELNK